MSSYVLEAPRARPANLHSTSFISSSVLSNHSDTTLLYDLPSGFSSPPSSPRRKGRITSMSPTYSQRNGGRPTPPPSAGRNRSTTPLGVAASELEVFTEHCRAWYFKQDDESGRAMTQILAETPPSRRAPFSRLQASVRSSYHHFVNAQRNAEFQAHITATLPGGSLSPLSRADPRGSNAQTERLERLERFIRSWCTTMSHPFFEALWAIMRIQTISPKIGGAGAHRIEWELDDAVFKETGGKNFMLESIDVLKGVLAFEERISSRRRSTSQNCDTPITVHSRSSSQPLPSHSELTFQPKRIRAPSDPFLDRTSRSIGSSYSPGSAVGALPTGSKTSKEPPSPVPQDRDDLLTDQTCDEDEYLRIWTSPDLTDLEFSELSKLFPSFITRRALPRFKIPTNTEPRDIEECGDDDEAEGRRIRFGTGSLSISRQLRTTGTQGSWWTIFCRWWARLFC